MCKRGEVTSTLVLVDGEWVERDIDNCIVDIVKALQEGGIKMQGSCCGHGFSEGDIELEDGRVLLVLDKKMGKEWYSKMAKDKSWCKRRQ